MMMIKQLKYKFFMSVILKTSCLFVFKLDDRVSHKSHRLSRLNKIKGDFRLEGFKVVNSFKKTLLRVLDLNLSLRNYLAYFIKGEFKLFKNYSNLSKELKKNLLFFKWNGLLYNTYLIEHFENKPNVNVTLNKSSFALLSKINTLISRIPFQIHASVR